MQKYKPGMIALVLAFVGLLLAGLAARFWFSERAYDLSGPTHIAAGGEGVFLFAAGDIFHLGRDGALISVSTPELIGLDDDPIDLRVNRDGRLLIAEQRPARIRSCDTETWQCRLLANVPASLVERQIKVLPDDRGELLLTDARGDMLWKLPEGQNEPRKLLPERTLAGPNDLVFGRDGTLWVADTDHRRIVELQAADDGGYTPGRSHSAKNPFTVGERHFPMMLAPGTDGRLWVTQAAEFSRPHADLLVYDPDAGAQGRVELPAGAYATDVVALGESLLLTDMERFTVYRVDAGTLAVSTFGDAAFRERLDRIRERRENFDRLGYLALAVVILSAGGMLVAAFLATPRQKRWTRPPAPFDWANAAESVPRVSGIHWLERDPKAERSLKWLEHIGFAGFILLAVGGLALYAWVRFQIGPDPDPELRSKMNDLGIILLLAGAVLALMVPVLRYSTRSMKRRLGTDGKRVFVRLEDGRQLAAEPAELSYTDRLVVIRKYTLPLLGGQQRLLYAPGEVETWLAPLLRDARKLSEWEALKLLITGRF